MDSRALQALVAGLKAYSTWENIRCLQDCHEGTGGMVSPQSLCHGMPVPIVPGRHADCPCDPWCVAQPCRPCMHRAGYVKRSATGPGPRSLWFMSFDFLWWW